VASPAPPPPPPSLQFVYATELRSSDPRRTQTHRALEQIRTGITVYLLVPLFAAINALIITAVLLSSNASFEGIYGGSGPGGVVASNSPAITASGDLFGIIGFILIIVAWAIWRGGVRSLGAAAGEYGPRQVAAARRAERDYGRTVYTFLAIFVFTIVVVVFIVAIVVGAVAQTTSSGSGLGPSSGGGNMTVIENPLAAAVGLIVAVAIIGVVLSVLLYHFATQSLVASLEAIASPGIVARLRLARSIVLVGAALQIFTGAAVADRLLYVASLPSPILLLAGFLLMRSAYSEWIEAPPPPVLGAGTAVPYQTAAAFVPAPTPPG
jgi:hypothetical protein